MTESVSADIQSAVSESLARVMWKYLCSAAGLKDGIGSSCDPFSMLRAFYAEPERHYHTIVHVLHCIQLCNETLGQTNAALEFALWFHDAIDRDEAASAAFARRSIGDLGGSLGLANNVSRLVMATKHDGTVRHAHDENLIADIDLAILGAEPDRFAEYERQIRDEYSDVSDDEYREGRVAVLRGFLERPTVYRTSEIGPRLEWQARYNLVEAVRRLRL